MRTILVAFLPALAITDAFCPINRGFVHTVHHRAVSARPTQQPHVHLSLFESRAPKTCIVTQRAEPVDREGAIRQRPGQACRNLLARVKNARLHNRLAPLLLPVAAMLLTAGTASAAGMPVAAILTRGRQPDGLLALALGYAASELISRLPNGTALKKYRSPALDSAFTVLSTASLLFVPFSLLGINAEAYIDRALGALSPFNLPPYALATILAAPVITYFYTKNQKSTSASKGDKNDVQVKMRLDIANPMFEKQLEHGGVVSLALYLLHELVVSPIANEAFYRDKLWTYITIPELGGDIWNLLATSAIAGKLSPVSTVVNGLLPGIVRMKYGVFSAMTYRFLFNAVGLMCALARRAAQGKNPVNA